MNDDAILACILFAQSQGLVVAKEAKGKYEDLRKDYQALAEVVQRRGVEIAALRAELEPFSKMSGRFTADDVRRIAALLDQKPPEETS